MDLGNFLGSLGGSVGSQVPGFAGGMIPTPPPVAAPMPQPPLQATARIPQKKPFAENALGKIMGVIGDALLARSGMQPIYTPMMMQNRQRRQQGQALQNYLGNLDPGLADLIGGGDVDVDTALELYKMTHERPDKPAGVDEYEYAKGQGFNGSYMDFLQQKGGPLIANNGDGTFTIVPRNMVGGGGQPQQQAGGDTPHVSDQASYDAVPPGGQYVTPDGNVRVKPGGPTATPSGGFPGQ